MSKYIYTPADVEKLCDVATTNQRERRLRGLFHYFGKQTESKRWKFSAEDLIGIHLSQKLEDFAGEQFEAERISKKIAPAIAIKLGCLDSIMPLRATHTTSTIREYYPDKDFVDILHCHKYAIFPRRDHPTFTDNPTRIADFDNPLYVLNLHKLAEEIPAKLTKRILADQALMDENKD